MIEICGLTKRFGKVNAVDNMTVNIPNGAVVGLVGSNGSGNQHFCVCLREYMHLTEEL